MFASSAAGSNLDKALAIAQPENIYYYGSKSLKKQSIPTVQRTNFIQNLASTTGGQSVITISPADGISHIIVGLKLPAQGGVVDYTGCALPKAWGYSAIDFVQWRYGSSSLFQKSGQQMLVETIVTAGSQSEANSLIDLSGNELKTLTDFAGDRLFAYVVIPLPHCGAQSGTESPNPFPSELLNAPIVITIALKRMVDILNVSPLVSPQPNLQFGFEEAYLQVRQINALDRSELFKISPSISYAYPCTFYQQENSVSLANTAGDQEVVLTGFRSGSCKGIHCWLIDESDEVNVNKFQLPRDMALSYAGNVIHQYKGVSSQILDTLYTDVPSYFNNSILSAAAAPTYWTSADTISSWTHFPLQQRFEQLSAEFTSVSGLGIANGVMNLRLKTPTASSNFRLYYVPYYDAALMFNNGMCEYVF